MIPNWLSKKRQEICIQCALVKTCADKITLLEDTPKCSLSKLHSLQDELRWAKAWPEHAEQLSGCCDSMAPGWGASR